MWFLFRPCLKGLISTACVMRVNHTQHVCQSDADTLLMPDFGKNAEWVCPTYREQPNPLFPADLFFLFHFDLPSLHPSSDSPSPSHLHLLLLLSQPVQTTPPLCLLHHHHRPLPPSFFQPCPLCVRQPPFMKSVTWAGFLATRWRCCPPTHITGAAGVEGMSFSLLLPTPSPSLVFWLFCFSS